jgi:hypothetical protein
MRTLVLWILIFVASAFGDEGGWKKYTNARFGFSVEYPPTLQASREPDNGAGREFHTANKEFSLTAHAHFIGVADEKESIDTLWSDALKELGSTITYKKKTATWYVVSGVTKEGTEYYHKLHTEGKNMAEIRISYPHAKNAKYDPWVERISKSFIPFLRGDYDRSR